MTAFTSRLRDHQCRGSAKNPSRDGRTSTKEQRSEQAPSGIPQHGCYCCAAVRPALVHEILCRNDDSLQSLEAKLIGSQLHSSWVFNRSWPVSELLAKRRRDETI
ncbi:hypothetical protein CT0861_04136 [Colletotrichum tofieldiae]|uniref:Uncharacterized protein n=1 Tax=Colletotrichum tofieldiae TaxID=708197 RepID=A0A166NFG2_9PEZI|nr:hypothetical protein CT0861_04136 [Colletotrichum tofieldiae]